MGQASAFVVTGVLLIFIPRRLRWARNPPSLSTDFRHLPGTAAGRADTIETRFARHRNQAETERPDYR